MEEADGMEQDRIYTRKQAMISPLRRIHALAIQALRPIDPSMFPALCTHHAHEESVAMGASAVYFCALSGTFM
jgi:hypothetical protein